MDHEKDWLSRLEGKTIVAVRPEHPAGPVPRVKLAFADGTEFVVDVKKGVYFEGCLINTLRRAQPVTEVWIMREGMDTVLTVESESFPLFMLMAVNKGLPSVDFPFELSESGASHG